jgi:hypothetical protein
MLPGHLELGVDARPSSTKPTNVETIGTHVVSHLQFLMLLTVRLIPIDDLPGTSADNQSLSSNPEDRSSDIGPDGDRDLDVEAGSDNALSESVVFELDFERQSESEIED